MYKILTVITLPIAIPILLILYISGKVSDNCFSGCGLRQLFIEYWNV